MFIPMNHLLFAGTMALLCIAFAFSMGREILRNRCEELEAKMEEYTKRYCESSFAYRKERVQLLRFKDALEQLFIINHLPWDSSKTAEELLAQLVQWECQVALDPRVSRGAQRLINKAKREHGKKIRAQAERKLLKALDGHKVLLLQRGNVLDQWKREAISERTNAVLMRNELSMYQGMVVDVLESIIKLPSVRNKFIQNLNEKHMAYQKESQ